MPVQSVDYRGMQRFTRCLQPQVLCCSRMYLFEWLQKFRHKFGSQNLKLVNALLYSFVNISDQNRILEHYYHEWLLLSYYSALNNNIETFHICQFTLPSSRKMTRLISGVAGEVRLLIEDQLKGARRVCITTDAWTSKLCNNAYLGRYRRLHKLSLLIIMNTFDYRGDGALPAPHRRKENGAKNKYVIHQLKHH